MQLIWKEFLELADWAIETARADLNIEVRYNIIKAGASWAVGRGSKGDEFVITITEMMRDDIFRHIVIENCLAKPIAFLVDKYHCSDNVDFHQRALCYTAWSLLFGHEVGHIFQGHALLLPLHAAAVINEGDPLSAQNVNGGGIDAELRSVIEYDADAYAGRLLAPAPKLMKFECADEKDREALGMCVITIAGYYLMTYFNSLSGDSSKYYPPVSMRVITLLLSFMHFHRHFKETGEVLRVDHEADYTLLQNEDFSAARKVATETLKNKFPEIDFSHDKIKAWGAIYERNKSKLLDIHERMRTTFPSSTDPKLMPLFRSNSLVTKNH